MKYISHSIGGLSFGLATASILAATSNISADIGLVVVGSAIVGGLFPDVDHPNSYISKKIPLLSLVATIFLEFCKFITNIICKFNKKGYQLKKEFEHRGIFHSLLFAILISLLIGFIPYEDILFVQIGFCAGYVSHLLMDMLTVSGVKIFFPITMKSIHYPLIRLHTGNTLHEFIASGIFIVIGIGISLLLENLVI